MKKVVLAVTLVLFSIVCVSDAHAWIFGGGKKSEENTAAVETGKKEAPAAAVSKEEKKLEAQKKQQQKAAEEALKVRLAQQQKITAQLNNNEWQIELTPLSGKGKKEVDTVVFKDNKVSVTGFVKKGFQPTNYSLTVQEDDMVIWETMQTSEGAGTAFWRGEMPKDLLSVRGVVSHVVDPKTKADYSFVSTAKRPLTAEVK